jgi:hypothetical protein
MSSSQDKSVHHDYEKLLPGDKAPALEDRPPQQLTRSEDESKVAACDPLGSRFACR